MSAQYPAATLRAARNLLDGRIAEVQHLMTGDEPAAWDMIRAFASEMAEAAKVAHLELAHYIHSQTNSPEEDAAMDLLEAETVENAHVHPHFAPLLNAVRRPA